MGICYYLLREDDHTLFDLGKSYYLAYLWRDMAVARRVEDRRSGRRVTVRAHDELALRAALVLVFDRRLVRGLARRLVQFADGHPLRLIDDAWDDDLLASCRRVDGQLRIVDSSYPNDWRRRDENGGAPLHEIWHGAEAP